MIKPEDNNNVLRQMLYPTILDSIIPLEGEYFTRVIMYDGTRILYHISNYGRVYSDLRKKFISLYLDAGGYYRVSIRISVGKTIFTGVHKLMLMSFYPITEPDKFVPNHKDGIKTHNNLSNLEWVTVSTNTRHALDTGLATYVGTNNARSYLSDEQIHIICENIKNGYEAAEIATILGYVNDQNERNKICAIIRNIRYGSAYMSISSQYDIPGMQGEYRFPEEMAYDICEIMSDRNNWNMDYDDLADVLDIEYGRRRFFKSFVIDIFKKAGYKYALEKYPKAKRPQQIKPGHKNYYLYF